MGDDGRLIMYTTTWCGSCRSVKAALERAGVDYDEVDIDEHPEAAAVVMRITGGYRSVPTLVFGDGRVLVEPRAHEVLAAIESERA